MTVLDRLKQELREVEQKYGKDSFVAKDLRAQIQPAMSPTRRRPLRGE